VSACALAVIAFASWAAPLSAAESDFPTFSAEQQLTLARAFAPTLVFHPREDYFPESSMDSLAGESSIEGWEERVAHYRSSSLQNRLQRAALAYRVFSRLENGQVEVVIEYWCYYVYNAFTVRGGWLPYKIADNHPNDLERLYLVLRPSAVGWPSENASDDTWARASFRIHRIVANAHDGSIPPNQYTTHAGESLAVPITVLVERGSHAMAPDIDNDGRFTPGIDSTAILKLQWGIRDSGSTWGWYRDSYMDGRDASSVRLCGPIGVGGTPDSDCRRYALYPAEDLQRWFKELQLSAQDRHEVVGRTPWLVRAFGDVHVENLMVPADPANGHHLDKMLRRRSQAEEGFLVGFTTVDHDPTLVVGRRDFWEIPTRHAPDIVTEANALMPNDRKTLVEATLWGSYSLDAITNVLFGFGYFSESGSPSPIVGSELRIGRFRVRPSWRLRDNGFDTRVTTLF